MPEGRESIKLLEPTDNGNHIQHDFSTRRVDRAGTLVDDPEIEQANWRTRFEIREHPLLKRVTERWLVQDGDNIIYGVISVGRIPVRRGNRKSGYFVYCIRQ